MNFQAKIKMTQWNIIAGLKKFDAYPKTLEDFRIQTRSGKEVISSAKNINDLLSHLKWTLEILNLLSADLIKLLN